MCMINLLSQNNIVMSIEILKYLSNCYIKTISLVISGKVRYHDFVKDLNTVSCLTNFQKITKKNTKKKVVGFLVYK